MIFLKTPLPAAELSGWQAGQGPVPAGCQRGRGRGRRRVKCDDHRRRSVELRPVACYLSAASGQSDVYTNHKNGVALWLGLTSRIIGSPVAGWTRLRPTRTRARPAEPSRAAASFT